jgi:hypothetical protein
MNDDATMTFLLRAQAAREIAEGLFDTTEREIVIKFVAECETLKLSVVPEAA